MLTTKEIKEQNIRKEVFKALLVFWKENNFTFGIAHGIENFPKVIGRDVDVLVENQDIIKILKKTEIFFEDLGWVVKTTHKPWAYWIHVFKKDNDGNFVGFEVDLFSRISWGSFILVDGPGEVYERNGMLLSLWGGFVKRVFIQFLTGNFDRFQKRPFELILQEYEKSYIIKQLENLLGCLLAEQLIQAINEKSIEKLNCIRKTIQKKIIIEGLKNWKTLPVVINDWFKKQFVLKIFPSKSAPVIAFIGPDGVGKSTIIKQFQHDLVSTLAFPGVIVKHWRPGFLPLLSKLLGKELKKTNGFYLPRRESGKFYWIRFFYYLFDFLLGNYLIDRQASAILKVNIYDRHAIDMEVDPVRFGLSSSNGMYLFRKLIPEPDIYIYLKAPAELIYKRKQELSIQDIQNQNKLYSKLFLKIPNSVCLDASKTIDQIVDKICNIYIHFYLYKKTNIESIIYGTE